ncbi:hypothetical protein Agub_g13850, partial [Astrephomene gubernaculifera]
LRPDVVAALEALQLPMEEVRQSLQREVAAAVEAARAAAAAAATDSTATAAGSILPLTDSAAISSAVAGCSIDAAGVSMVADAAGAATAAAAAVLPDEERVSYFAVSGFDEEALRAAAWAVLPAELHGRLRRGEMHVTLWHRNDPSLGPRTDLRRALLGLLGSRVELG